MQKNRLSVSRSTYIALLAATALVAGCAQQPRDPRAEAAVPGLVMVATDRNVDTAFAGIDAQLSAAQPIGVVARIDHAANAPAATPLRPTRLMLFGNPSLGTPLMQADQTAGIDLPQKFLVYQDAQGRTQIAYNGADYLAQRHGIGEVPTLAKIDGALQKFSKGASGSMVSPLAQGAGTVGRGEGLVSVPSNADTATTFARLRAAVQANPALEIVAELDHAANAAKVGLQLRPTRLLVFGNPALGTPLMRAAQTIGIDLPQKMLVYTDAADRTFVVYNDPAFLARRHGATGVNDSVAKISAALSQLAAAAAGT